MSDSRPSVGGSSNNGAEGALQAFQNLRQLSIVTVAEASSSSIPAFAKSPMVDQTVKEVLPKFELGGGGSSGPNSDLSLSLNEIGSASQGALKGIMDIAGKLADPLGFLSFFFSFLQELFTQSLVASAVPALRPEALYSQAAQAALDAKNWRLNS